MSDERPDTSAPRACSKCRARPASPSHYWCSVCRKPPYHRPSQPDSPAVPSSPKRQEWGQRGQPEGTAGDTLSGPPAQAGPAPTRPLAANAGDPDLPPFKPFPEGVPEDLPPWATVYLATLAETGGPTLSANAAGVTPRLVRQLQDAHPAFAEAARDAVQYYHDVLAKDLPGTSKPVGGIARLKSINPVLWETALIVSNVQHNTLNVGAPPPGIDPEALLEQILARLSPMELRAMHGEVIDDVPGVLLAAPAPGDER